MAVDEWPLIDPGNLRRNGGSSLQRYCAGIMVPSDYGPIYRFGWACGAAQEELRELHRLWALADASRRDQSRPSPEPGAARPQSKAPETTPGGAPGGDGAADGQRWPRPPLRLGTGGRGRGARARWALAGLEPNGVVDQATKQALYAGKVSMRTWSPTQVARRIKQVFTQAPAEALAIARCQSFLDPLYILSNTNGTRDWGVFQISDLTLQQLGGTPAKALNPAWNIEAVWRLWKMHKSFSAWPFCLQAYRAGASPQS
jgi:hypothetical protein